MTRKSVVLTFVLGLAPAIAPGQGLGFLDKVFSNVSDVNATRLFGKPYAGRGVIAGSRLTGLGIEVTFDAGAIVPRSQRACRNAAVRSRDSTLQEIRVRYEGKEVRESTLVYAIRPHECDARSWLDAELGFGYTQMQGLRGVSAIQGSIEELPAASLYVVSFPDSPIQPYVGLITGLAQLKDVRAMGDSGLISAAGSTFEYGALLGLGVTVTDRAALFVEISWVARQFEGITWTASGSGPAVVPAALQTPLRLSTRTIAVGGQIRFVHDKE